MNRGAFIVSSASLAALAASPAVAAESVPGGTHLVERKADFDEAAFAKMVGRPADVRIVIESIAFHPQAFSNVKNALNGLQFGFGYPENRIALVFAPHGASSAFTYTDYVWDKYKIGDFFKLKDDKGAAITSNTFLTPSKPLTSADDPDQAGGFYQDTSIQTLQKRGVMFLTCHTAVEEQARGLVKAGNAPSGMSPADVANDILTHLIPGTHVVPSMMATIMVLQQRYRYGFQALTFA